MKQFIAFTSIPIFLFCGSLSAQVPKKVVVEHFTNSNCSVCASRNPGFYSNLNTQSNVLHLAIHPSAPYASCKINQHNVIENDARTNYYGVYGSTPRLVVQGVVVAASANYASATIFSPYAGQTSPIELKIRQINFGDDSLQLTVVMRTAASHNLGNLRLFVSLVEDTLFYTGTNGENRHFDVFRKSLDAVTGIPLSLSLSPGDSMQLKFSSAMHPAWQPKRMYGLAILQEENSKAVVQAERVTESTFIPTGLSSLRASTTSEKITWLQANKELKITGTNFPSTSDLKIIDAQGKMLLNEKLQGDKNSFSLAHLAAGIYFVQIDNRVTMPQTLKIVVTAD